MIGANREVRIHHYTPGAKDSRGNKTAVWVPALEWVPANLFVKVSRSLVDGVVTTVREMKCRLGRDVTVGARDLIEDRDGNRYRVSTVDRRRSFSGHVWHVMCTLEEDSVDAAG